MLHPFDFSEKMKAATERFTAVAKLCAWELSLECAFMAGERWSVCSIEEDARLVELMAREHFRARYPYYI